MTMNLVQEIRNARVAAMHRGDELLRAARGKTAVIRRGDETMDTKQPTGPTLKFDASDPDDFQELQSFEFDGRISVGGGRVLACRPVLDCDGWVTGVTIGAQLKADTVPPMIRRLRGSIAEAALQFARLAHLGVYVDQDGRNVCPSPSDVATHKVMLLEHIKHESSNLLLELSKPR